MYSNNCKSTISQQHKGFSLVEVIVASALLLLVFGGLFAGFQLMVETIGVSKAKAGGLALATERLEYLRSLPYNSLGTVGGVPDGLLAQHATTTLNGITYTERLLIQYVDDDADGVGGADGNGILADYKQIKVVYAWNMRGKDGEVILVSNVVPTGIETTAGGGTIRVNVFDAMVLPVAGAEVRFVNKTTTSTIDTLRYTDVTGTAYLSGAPAAADYEITVTDTGYSTDGTYVATTSNPNPTTPPIAVLVSQISTMNFQIDEVSDLLITAVGVPTYGSMIDTFSSTALLFTQSSTTVSGGALELDGGPSLYKTLGVAQSTSTTPGTIDAWYTLAFVASSSASTTVRASIMYDNAGTLTLVPDGDLPGNSAGFTSSPIDISNLDVLTYTTLAPVWTLTSVDSNETPKVHEYALTHIQTQPTISGVDLTLAGAKSIGIDGASQPVLKFVTSGTTDGDGAWTHTDLEWDVYTLNVDSVGYSVYEVCPSSPYSLSPDVAEEMIVTLGGVVTQLLRVSVEDASGDAIAGAQVHLENIGVDQTHETSLCGQTYFNSGLYDDDDYLLTVSAAGYTTQVLASTTVSSSSTVNVVLN